MKLWTGMGYLLGSMMLIKLVGDGAMPGLLTSVARTGGVFSRGVQGIFRAV